MYIMLKVCCARVKNLIFLFVFLITDYLSSPLWTLTWIDCFYFSFTFYFVCASLYRWTGTVACNRFRYFSNISMTKITEKYRIRNFGKTKFFLEFYDANRWAPYHSDKICYKSCFVWCSTCIKMATTWSTLISIIHSVQKWLFLKSDWWWLIWTFDLASFAHTMNIFVILLDGSHEP